MIRNKQCKHGQKELGAHTTDNHLSMFIKICMHIGLIIIPHFQQLYISFNNTQVWLSTSEQTIKAPCNLISDCLIYLCANMLDHFSSENKLLLILVLSKYSKLFIARFATKTTAGNHAKMKAATKLHETNNLQQTVSQTCPVCAGICGIC